MDQENARRMLEYLVRKYINDNRKIDELANIIWDKSLPAVPVRGIINDINECAYKEIDIKDANIVKDLIFYFG